LAHNERHPDTGNSVARVIHNFGRAEQVDRAALARLVSSISRFLTPEQALTAAAGAEVEVLDSRRLGGAWTLDRVWERLGIGAAVRRVATSRRLDAEAVERVLFALVAQRALEPASKLAGTRWVAERVAIEGCPGFSDDAAYRAMDFLLDALGEIAGEVFGSVATLLNLDLDIVFVDIDVLGGRQRRRPGRPGLVKCSVYGVAISFGSVGELIGGEQALLGAVA
jgi:hypothetical protein